MAPWCRQNILALSTSTLGLLAMAWLALYGFAWNDYDTEAAPALAALRGGQLSHALQLAPAYGGSLELRAPFALLPGLWGGGALAVYRSMAAPCLIASAVLGVSLLAPMRARCANRLARTTVLALCVANPITLRALELGHPEDLLGAAMCAAAVLLAMHERAFWAGVVLGLAVANKEWALLAAGPMLIALPSRRVFTSLTASCVAAVILLPLLLARSAGVGAVPQLAAAHTGAIFQPWQIWWFFGTHGHPVHGLFGALKPGYRTAPGWLESVAHPLIAIVWVPLTALVARRRQPRFGDPLLLLALLMLLRCALDPWDTAYYALPLLFALLSWEALTRRGPPALSLTATVVIWVIFQELPSQISPDAQAAVFTAVALPGAVLLALALFRPHLPRLSASRTKESAITRRAAAAS